jgi:hypothetical protein
MFIMRFLRMIDEKIKFVTHLDSFFDRPFGHCHHMLSGINIGESDATEYANVAITTEFDMDRLACLGYKPFHASEVFTH